MLNKRLTRIEKQLKAGLSRQTLEERGRRSGFERRAARVITTTEFVTSLLQSLGTRRVESLADLHRDFNADHGTSVNYKPYYERLDSAGFVELMRSLFESLLSTLYQRTLAPLRDSVLNCFEDVVLHDGSSFALHDDLKGTFPGRFTTVSPSAVELHATMSLMHDNLTSLTLTADSECERLYRKLFLADRGYDSIAFMEEIEQAGGSFCIRIRSCLDPLVTKIHRRGTRYRKLEGKRLSTVIARLPKGKVHDLDIEWRQRDGTPRNGHRLLLRHHGPEHGWIRLMNNLPRERFADRDVLAAYRLRWQVELYFKELKSYANLHAFSTCKPHIAQGLIWASLCVAFLKRFFAHACQQASAVAISTRRVAMCSHVFLATFFQCLRAGFADLRAVLLETFDFLAVNARRANTPRERKTGRLALNLTPHGVPLK